jgi:hypothetical protein
MEGQKIKELITDQVRHEADELWKDLSLVRIAMPAQRIEQAGDAPGKVAEDYPDKKGEKNG